MSWKVIFALAALGTAGWLMAGPHAMAAEPKIAANSFEAKVYESPKGGKLLYRQLSRPSSRAAGSTRWSCFFTARAGAATTTSARSPTRDSALICSTRSISPSGTCAS